MAEPITLYPVKGGEPLVTAAPRYAAELVEAGQYSYTPLPEPATEAPAQSLNEADEKPAAVTQPATAKQATRRKGQL